MQYTDRNLTCVDCGAEFVHSAEDQEYHASRGFQNEPRRCSSCRQARRSERDGGSSAPHEMHPVVCAECGRETEVPFLPRGDRPVYCRDCFAKQQPERTRS